MANVFFEGCAALRAASTAASTCASASRAWSRNALPAAVSSTPRTLRDSNSPDLIFQIADLPAERGLGGVQPALAAIVRLPSSTTAQNNADASTP